MDRFIIFIVLISLFSCKQEPTILLSAERLADIIPIDNDTLSDEILILYNDSTYSYRTPTYHHLGRKPVKYIQGKWKINCDTLILDKVIEDIETNKAILQNNEVEFFNFKYSIKFPIIHTTLDIPQKYNVDKYNMLTQFYMPVYPQITFKEFESFKNIFLSNQELDALISNLENLFKTEEELKNLYFKDYFMQIATIENEHQEKVSFIQFICNNSLIELQPKNTFLTVNDGGDCYLDLKYNNTLKKIYQLQINGY